MESTTVANSEALSDEQICRVEKMKVFFGHQSVGANIVQGIKDLMARDPRLKLKIVTSGEPETVPGPAFVEFPIGENGNARSKNRAFAAILDRGMGAQGGVAMYKYCYVDIDNSTDIRKMFESYREGIAALKAKYPLLKIVHITVPLTTVEPATKAWIKALLGRATARDANAKRNEFNRLLRETYAATDPIFDLAKVESTHPDGLRSYFFSGKIEAYSLAPEMTTDGGHLNQTGRRIAAEQLLLVLATL